VNADEKRFVAVSAVEDAYGRTEEAVPVAMKLFAVTELAKIADDEAKIRSLNHTAIVVVGVRVRVL
jgi:hypothetical protein